MAYMSTKSKKLTSSVGAILATFGFLSALIGYFGSVYVFFESDRVLFALIALFVPPADIVLGFVAHPVLGLMATGGMLFLYGGLALIPD